MEIKTTVNLSSEEIENILLALAKDKKGTDFINFYMQIYKLTNDLEAQRIYCYIRKALGFSNFIGNY
jgi:hypothetical protein